MRRPNSRSRNQNLMRVCALAITLCLLAACDRQSVSGKFDPAATPSVPSSTAATKTDAILLKAGGDEPGWALTVLQSGVTFEGDYGALKFAGPLEPSSPPDPNQFVARANGQTLFAKLDGKVCRSSMTGMPFQSGVTVTLGARTFTGCGGEPQAFLTGKTWRGVEIVGKASAGKMPSLVFAQTEDFPVLLEGPCSQRVGIWRLTGESLTIKMDEAIATPVCDRADRESLSALTDLLSRVTRFDVAPDGTLLLIESDTSKIRLSDPEALDPNSQ
jgi:heat shock protein HslJ